MKHYNNKTTITIIVIVLILLIILAFSSNFSFLSNDSNKFVGKWYNSNNLGQGLIFYNDGTGEVLQAGLLAPQINAFKWHIDQNTLYFESIENGQIIQGKQYRYTFVGEKTLILGTDTWVRVKDLQVQ